MSEAEVFSNLCHSDPEFMVSLFADNYKISGEVVDQIFEESRIVKGDKELFSVFGLIVPEDVGEILTARC